MVSIQNPSVTVSDVWSYTDRAITNVNEIALKSTDTLLNSILGANFDQDSVGYYLTKGIAQTVIDATKNVNTINYMMIIPTTGKRVNKNLLACVCTGYYSLATMNNKLQVVYTQSDPILDNISIPDYYLSTFVIIPKTIGSCVADMSVPINGRFTNDAGDTSSLGVRNVPKYDYDSDNFYVRLTTSDIASNGGRIKFEAQRYAINYDKTGLSTPGELTVPITLLANYDKVFKSPATFTLSNFQTSDISGIYVSLPDINFFDITIELLINDTVTDTFTMSGQKDYFGTPSGWSRKGVLSTDTVSVRLTCANNEPCFVVPIKSLIVSTALTPSGE